MREKKLAFSTADNFCVLALFLFYFTADARPAGCRVADHRMNDSPCLVSDDSLIISLCWRVGSPVAQWEESMGETEHVVATLNVCISVNKQCRSLKVVSSV